MELTDDQLVVLHMVACNPMTHAAGLRDQILEHTDEFPLSGMVECLSFLQLNRLVKKSRFGTSDIWAINNRGAAEMHTTDSLCRLMELLG